MNTKNAAWRVKKSIVPSGIVIQPVTTVVPLELRSEP
jgi:hypothetical protein